MFYSDYEGNQPKQKSQISQTVEAQNAGLHQDDFSSYNGPIIHQAVQLCSLIKSNSNI